ncbi:MAG: endopeptidase La [Ruminococcaceae bacterium]|nr:endopeptidase La [Oscillospiraceae bacterium]
MSRYIEKIEQHSLPVIALRGAVAFPAVSLSFELTDELCIHAAEAAFATDSHVLVCTVKDPEEERLTPTSLYRVGTVSRIKQSVKTPDGGMRIITEGFSRATVTEFRSFADYLCADAISKVLTMTDEDSIRSEAYCRAMLSETEQLVALLPSVSDDVLTAARSIRNPALLADFIASNILVKYPDKQQILECFDPVKRIELLIALLKEETALLECELDIHKRVRANLNQNQKEYYLREQVRVIQDELGDTGDVDEYYEKILSAELPDEVREKLLKENDRMAKTPFGSSEASVIRAYLDTCLDIPWSAKTKDRIDIKAAQKILDADHDGLERVKERILEYLAVKQLNPSLGNQILCLVGPPGVGKTSVGASIAKAMKRKYVRVSLGGVRDEADIRGHRKTYIGAMPGRIINALIQAKVRNPLILLDEIDKVTRDAHGDPSSALLEVLDAEQNKAFRDHFIELPFDLSDCLFIATANTLDTIPRPLLDRMEVIELKTYTKTEKLSIAKHHLIPKQVKRHGLTRRMLTVTDGAVLELIDYYTREAGVRNLERSIADLCRKAARKFVEDSELKRLRITEAEIAEYLGVRKLRPDRIAERDEVGVVNGLAYTAVGGDMLRVEVAVLEGTGKIELTGSLGDVMKESARIAVSYVRSIAAEYGIAPDFYQKKDIHIHFPEGAVPKDGPSAGVTIVTALVSALTRRKVRRDVAMTGEISLRGNVLAIGGLKEKTMAAYSAGVTAVLLPEDNLQNLEEIDPAARQALTFLPCKKASEVLAYALCPAEELSVQATVKTAEEPSYPEVIPNRTVHSNPIPLGR